MFQFFTETGNVIKTYWKNNTFNWYNIVFLTVVHFAGIYGTTLCSEAKWKTNFFAFLLLIISEIGITAGVHRLWSHRSYEATFLYRLLLMIMASIANQGSIYHWVRDHRIHHKFSETHADPHNAKNGFFYAHIGWLFVKKSKEVKEARKLIDMSDIKNDPILMFQKRMDPWFAQFCCFIIPALIAKYYWDETFWNGIFIPGVLRYLCSLHFTWLVNSAAHLYGSRPYDETINPAENLLVSILSVGEGWHNWHHRYPYDYAASEFGIHRQYNPTKAWFDFFALLGMVKNRKRALSAWDKNKKKI